MKFRIFASAILAAFMITACDSTTDEIGTSLSNNTKDQIIVSTDTFQVTTRSVAANSVLSRSSFGALGKVKDTETGSYVTGNFMTQFHTLENFKLPALDSIVSKTDGLAYADSCDIRLYFDDFYGDSLATMKVRAMELKTPYKEGVDYYSDFNPEANGMVRSNGIKVDKAYTITDLGLSKGERKSKEYFKHIKISLNDPYTGADGKTYKNFGTYVMQMYYAHPEYFKNSYKLIQNVIPGFYFKTQSGQGSMMYIYASLMNIYFKAKDSTTYVGSTRFAGTTEVLQSTEISNENTAPLLADKSCTYLKSPAGIYTEMTLPVEKIMQNHERDSINTAEIVLQRLNNTTTSKYTFDFPKELLLIPADSLASFFKNKQVTDSRTSFLTVADTKQINNTTSRYTNTYTFHNIGSLIKKMYDNKKAGKASANWNKVLIIPVKSTTVTANNTTVISGIYHDMTLKSTRLVGGDTPIKINVIYSKFK
uniref:DUF4270 domain-containing protein n=1 Tax=Prevotella sp. GTC17253 TaxID=3236793 RepID=A0AB33ISV7_9BACT